MYRLVHTQHMRTMQRNIEALKTLQVSQLQLQMRCEWWLQLFEPQVDVQETKDGKTEDVGKQNSIELMSIVV